MKIYEASLIVVIVVVSVCILAGTVSSLIWKKDNPIEEAAEAVIKAETVVSVDLSPEIQNPPHENG